MAYLTVTTQADVVDPSDGRLSLREAVAQANAGASADTIRFIAALEGKTLVLTGGELAVDQDLTIDGDANGDGTQVTVDGHANGRILNIAGAGTDVTVKGITLTNGEVGSYVNGGAILLRGGSLTLNGATLRGNRAGTYRDSAGGALAASDGSRVAVIGSSILDNEAGDAGGGIAAMGKSTVVIRASHLSGNHVPYSGGGGVRVSGGSSLVMDESTADGNRGSAVQVVDGTATIARSTIRNNSAEGPGGGISAWGSQVDVVDSTVAANSGSWPYDDTDYGGGGIGGLNNSVVSIRNSTLTGNRFDNDSYTANGGGVFVASGGRLEIGNSIVVGNSTSSRYATAADPDVSRRVDTSNGHNVFGSTVTGSIAGDRQNVAAASVFAAVDPTTGGGKLSPTGIVPLKNALTNPALSAADPITASSFGQLGTTKRPLPAGSLPDIGAIEIAQSLSTSPTVNNDVLTGSGGANNLAGLAGNDLIQGLAGTDTLNGNDGSDVLDGGPGNDVLNGGNGVDIATFAGSTAVVVDLAAKPATAKRGGETDTLTSIEGAIGSSKADIFKGDAQNNEFQGGLGKDTATGGGGRDLYAFKSVADSPAGSGRDVIKDFAPGQDVIDVSDIDADSTTPGQQTFRWVGKAVLTGAAQLGYYVSGGNTIVRASTNADAKPELEIQLNGSKTLTAADFRF
ncbi:MAG: right-handed parallel beta-helix repeat-containing protein [Geminicoccaceae bacterium]